MTLIVAVDPGKTTGVKWINPDDSTSLGGAQVDVEDFFQLMTGVVESWTSAGHEVQLVSESFLITVNTAKNSQAGWSLELIGVMKYLAWRYKLPELKQQTPQVAKKFSSDPKLKQVDWYTKGKGHENDAARHLMTYCATRRLVFTTDQLKDMALL